ncbi:hypothetical protein LTR99_008831 [Exophiala xenobiotica]|uniref:Uncharacterized protein n=1 Tax=Vermiconidia calcicola TaxID=1690605 RepID=A0AAV9Q109_9PEZI|nr:hypothetical protein LTR92_009542 [Exophiala xenobiotica]KAK5533475.1 hypothetical protein LTR25_007341 [Vermiconidia calcicola]KAK5265693.1 hypothetical protein LTR96_009100 [Exophiala xenobiotica]KAK5296464.1 hypothetical protein LTR99_008831 [Exophiala xenobiotica]KAK5427777.1 hypothetical protein LTR34_008719 [Exophiala xenobiotica]
MRALSVIILWTSLLAVAAVAQEQQIRLDEDYGKKYNVTLNFDDIPTNSSGIGFDPDTQSNPLHYNDLYFQSFTVVNVAKARDSLPDPIDLLCASSAPNALFSSRKAGHPWPRFSFHDLSKPPKAGDANVTFNMRSLTLSPTGNVSGPGHGNDQVLLNLRISLLRLPSYDESGSGSSRDGSWGTGFPGLIGGSPSIPQGAHIYQLIVVFGPGRHQSVKIDYSRFTRIIPGYGQGVDIGEVVADLYRWDKAKHRWYLVGDWEVCLDDVEIEVVQGGKKRDKEEEEEDGSILENTDTQGRESRLFMTVTEDGRLIDDKERGEKLWREMEQERNPWVSGMGDVVGDNVEDHQATI